MNRVGGIMVDQVTLSESAVAVLRFEIKGYRPRDPQRRLPAYRELAEAGIMEPVPGSEAEYRFTEEGFARREEILREAEAHRRSLQARLPDRIELSGAAVELVRRLVFTEARIDVEPDNLEVYRELARVGIMYPVSTFARGPEAIFRFTDQGWDRRHEWIARPTESP